jgi:hypothetical protein
MMIGQNGADEKRQVVADQQWRTVQEEEQQNETLLRLSNEILGLTKEIYTASTAAMPLSPMGEDHWCSMKVESGPSAGRVPATFVLAELIQQADPATKEQLPGHAGCCLAWRHATVPRGR